MSRFDDMLKDLAALKAKKDELNAELSEVNKELEETQVAIYEQFVNEGVSSMKVPGLGTFGGKVTRRASIKSETKEKTLEAIKKEWPDLVKETVNAQTLSATIREYEKEGMEIPKEIMDGLSIYDQISITWRRST